MSDIRAFIAIQLPPAAQNELGEINDSFANQIPRGSVRWVKPHLMHLTLRFLGDTAESALPQIIEALNIVGKNHRHFSLYFDRLGCFPDCKRPRVIWAGLQGDLDKANSLKQALDEALQPLGWPLENRPFSPHITIGRIKDTKKISGMTWAAQLDKQLIGVKEIHLVQSKLTPGGPVYTIRHSSQLLG